jgi:hypothetical protein
MQPVRARAAAVVLAALVSFFTPSAFAGDPYVIDFFPEGEQINHTIQLRFLGPTEGTITNARLSVDFTTAQGFRAEDLTILLVAPVAGEGNFWFLTGEDLGWSGHGTFHANVSTNEMNGVLQPGLWGNDIGSINDPPAYSGTFSDTSHFEIDIAPVPEPACGALVGLGVIGLARRRRA